MAESVYERLEIQVAESHRSQVQIPLGIAMMEKILKNKKNVGPALSYLFGTVITCYLSGGEAL